MHVAQQQGCLSLVHMWPPPTIYHPKSSGGREKDIQPYYLGKKTKNKKKRIYISRADKEVKSSEYKGPEMCIACVSI